MIVWASLDIFGHVVAIYATEAIAKKWSATGNIKRFMVMDH